MAKDPWAVQSIGEPAESEDSEWEVASIGDPGKPDLPPTMSAEESFAMSLPSVKGEGFSQEEVAKMKLQIPHMGPLTEGVRLALGSYPKFDSMVGDAVDSLEQVKNSMMAYPGLVQNLAGMLMSPKPTDEVARGLGYEDAEDFRTKTSEQSRENLLKGAGVIEQVTGGIASQVIDPLAIATGSYGLSAQGFSRVLKLSTGGATYGGLLETTQQLADSGKITSPGMIAAITAVGGVAPPVLDKAIRVGARAVSNQVLKNIEVDTQKFIKDGYNPEAAYDKALYKRGMSAEEVASVVDGTGRTQHKMRAVTPVADYAKTKNSYLRNQIHRMKTGVEKVKKGIDSIIQPWNSHVERISPGVLNAVRRMDLRTHQLTNKWRGIADPFVNHTEQLRKVSPDAYRGLKFAVRNRLHDQAERIIKGYSKNPEAMLREFRNVRGLLDDIFKRYRAVGVDVNYLPDYMPLPLKPGHYPDLVRKLGTKERSIVETALYDKATKLGKKSIKQLTDSEKTNVLNSLFVGVTPEGLRVPGPARKRVLETIPAKLLDDYADIGDGLYSYIDSAAAKISERDFFGRHLKRDPDIDPDLPESIGKFVGNLQNRGEIGFKESDELKELLNIRFGYKESPRLLQALKNVFYLTKLAQIQSAVTQLGDLGIAAARQGLGRSIVASGRITAANMTDLLDAATFKFGSDVLSSVRPKYVTLEDLGLRKIGQEFHTTSRTAKALDMGFRYSGFKAVDRLGKEVTLNAALNKYSSMVGKPKGVEKFRKKWEPFFGKDTNKLIKDLQTGRKSENVSLLLWNELADAQPISLSEVPPAYLSAPWGRVWYALKTFTTKQLDLVRKEAVRKMVKGSFKERVEGAAWMTRFGMYFTAANMTADQIKSWMNGRLGDEEWSDIVVENLWKNFGASQWLVDHFKDKPAVAVIDYIGGFATGLADSVENIVGDLRNFGNQFETLQDVPPVGRLMYNLFGGGADKWAEKQRKKFMKTDEMQELLNPDGLPDSGGY